MVQTHLAAPSLIRVDFPRSTTPGHEPYQAWDEFLVFKVWKKLQTDSSDETTYYPYTIRIGSTPTFYISICISTLPTQHTAFIPAKLLDGEGVVRLVRLPGTFCIPSIPF